MSDKIAKVVGFFKSGAPQIQFDGESSASEKEFPFLKSCQPKVDDRVYMKEFANSYIIFDVIYFERGLEPPININKIEGDLVVNGKITSKETQVNGKSTVNGTFYSEGYSYFARELECKSSLLVRGGSVFKDNIVVESGSTFQDIVNIDGDIEDYILKVNNKGGAGLEVSSKSGKKTIQASGQINSYDSFYTKGWIQAIGTVNGSNIK
mgnify:CR=1 FL=1